MGLKSWRANMVMRKRFSIWSGEYVPERDGELKTYLERQDGGTFCLFKGYKQYKMLWDQGFLEPDITHIRLMWNIGRGDEFFGVRGLHEIEGYDNIPFHTARSGIHDPKKVLEEGPGFEVHYFNPNPVPRVPEKKKR
jgi:hypothetical protein